MLRDDAVVCREFVRATAEPRGLSAPALNPWNARVRLRRLGSPLGVETSRRASPASDSPRPSTSAQVEAGEGRKRYRATRKDPSGESKGRSAATLPRTRRGGGGEGGGGGGGDRPRKAQRAGATPCDAPHPLPPMPRRRARRRGAAAHRSCLPEGREEVGFTGNILIATDLATLGRKIILTRIKHGGGGARCHFIKGGESNPSPSPYSLSHLSLCPARAAKHTRQEASCPVR